MEYWNKFYKSQSSPTFLCIFHTECIKNLLFLKVVSCCISYVFYPYLLKQDIAFQMCSESCTYVCKGFICLSGEVNSEFSLEKERKSKYQDFIISSIFLNRCSLLLHVNSLAEMSLVPRFVFTYWMGRLDIQSSVLFSLWGKPSHLFLFIPLYFCLGNRI